MPEIFEVLMIVCVGLSWPLSIYKSWISRTAEGKSLQFEVFIWIGYICGIASKVSRILISGPQSGLFYLAMVFYCINLVAVSIDILLYFHNKGLDRQRAAR